MEIKAKKTKKAHAVFSVSLEPKELIPYFEKALEEVAKGVKIDGFRPGKAPRRLIESAVGTTRIMSEAIEMAVRDGYMKAVIQEKANPVSSPNISIKTYPIYGFSEAEIKKPLEFEAEVDVLEGVELGDYSKLKITPPKKDEVKDDDIKKVMVNLTRQKSQLNDIDRTAKNGDFAEISYTGYLKKVKIDAMTSKHHPIIIGEKSLIPGFEEELIGMKKGDKKTFKIKFPKDYHNKEYAGKDAEFEVEINQLKEVIKPELNDEFAKSFGAENMKALEKKIKENLSAEIDRAHENNLEIMALEKALPLLKAELPDSMVDHEVEHMLARFRDQITAQGMDFDKYIEMTKKTEADIRKEMRPQAEKNIKIGLMLGRIIEEKKWDPKDHESSHKAIEHLVKSMTKK